jgi:hypothetical protein
MKYFIISILTLLTFSSFAQKEIKIEDVKDHIGDSVKLTAKIYGGKFIESAQGTPTFLNVGDKYPNAPLTLVIGVIQGNNLTQLRKPFTPAGM